jgi:predicted transcriptional regulator
MRTTLDINDEAYALAKTIARDRSQSLGRTVSDLITAGYLSYKTPSPGWRVSERNGFPVVDTGRVVTDQEVAAFLDEGE